MSPIFTSEQVFEKIDFTVKPISKGEYEDCCFIQCQFTESDVKNIRFTDCTFIGCNLDKAKLAGSTFNEVVFENCSMTELHFDTCNELLFTVRFRNCELNHSIFYKRKIKKTEFENCRLKKVDFTESDLAGSTFDTCDLEHAVFENTILEKADFRSSYNFRIDPDRNRIKKARFSIYGLAGLLDKYDLAIES